MEKFSVLRHDIIGGAFCPECGPTLIMNRKYGRWECSVCTKKCKKAHVEPLKDYALLISPTITMCELIRYLRMENSITIRKLLKELNIPSTGNT
ncbi:hypothetical protein [Sutcliffiella rhizosphaerae]|nr:hypothetical protein [Sutcliffiella rhizosphaerae]